MVFERFFTLAIRVACLSGGIQPYGGAEFGAFVLKLEFIILLLYRNRKRSKRNLFGCDFNHISAIRNPEIYDIVI